MKRLMVAMLMALFVYTAAPAQAITLNCKEVGATGWVVKQYRLAYNWAKRATLNGFRGRSDVYTMLTTSTGSGIEPRADIVEVWAALPCYAVNKADGEAAQLRIRWAKATRMSADEFDLAEGYKHYVQRLQYAPDHLLMQLIGPAEKQLLADTLAWAARTNPGRFSRSLAVMTQALGLPPPGR